MDTYELMMEAEDASGQIPTGPKAQKALVEHTGKFYQDKLAERWIKEGKTKDLARLRDIQVKGQDHTWILQLPGGGKMALTPVEWLTAVKLRQGVWINSGPTECAECGGTVDPEGYHCSCCAKGGVHKRPQRLKRRSSPVLQRSGRQCGD